MRRVFFGIVAALAAISFGSGASVLAAPAENVSFFQGADGSAHWASRQSAIVLSETTTPGAFAGAQLMHVGAVAPPAAPSFEQLDSQDMSGGGSPRLVIAFADGGTIYGYRLQMSTDLQQDPLHWDSMGPFAYNVGYEAALALHSNSPVVAAYIVTDSGWEGVPYTNTITHVIYGDNEYAG